MHDKVHVLPTYEGVEMRTFCVDLLAETSASAENVLHIFLAALSMHQVHSIAVLKEDCACQVSYVLACQQRLRLVDIYGSGSDCFLQASKG